jgi:hypothetical protein
MTFESLKQPCEDVYRRRFQSELVNVQKLKATAISSNMTQNLSAASAAPHGT